MKRTLAIVGAAGLLVAGAVTAAVAPAGATASGCRVGYAVLSQWPGGFTATVTVTNLGDPVNGWVLGFDFTAGQWVTQLWNAAWSQSGTRVTATNLPFNSALGTGASVMFGFNGAWTGSNPSPTGFSMNGVACTGAVTSATPSASRSASPSPSASPSASTTSGNLPPVVKLTSPNSTSIYGEPGTIPLAAQASDPDGTITKVEFYAAPYSGTPFTLVATDTTAPYSFQLTVPTASSVWVIQAKAYDNGGLVATDTVRMKVAVVDPTP